MVESCSICGNPDHPFWKEEEVEEKEYECASTGCDFVGTKPECLDHEGTKPDHDYFYEIPSWEELVGGGWIDGPSHVADPSTIRGEG